MTIFLKSSRLISFSLPTVCLNILSSHCKFRSSKPTFDLRINSIEMKNIWEHKFSFGLPRTTYGGDKLHYLLGGDASGVLDVDKSKQFFDYLENFWKSFKCRNFFSWNIWHNIYQIPFFFRPTYPFGMKNLSKRCIINSFFAAQNVNDTLDLVDEVILFLVPRNFSFKLCYLFIYLKNLR